MQLTGLVLLAMVNHYKFLLSIVETSKDSIILTIWHLKIKSQKDGEIRSHYCLLWFCSNYCLQWL